MHFIAVHLAGSESEDKWPSPRSFSFSQFFFFFLWQNVKDLNGVSCLTHALLLPAALLGSEREYRFWIRLNFFGWTSTVCSVVAPEPIPWIRGLFLRLSPKVGERALRANAL